MAQQSLVGQIRSSSLSRLYDHTLTHHTW